MVNYPVNFPVRELVTTEHALEEILCVDLLLLRDCFGDTYLWRRFDIDHVVCHNVGFDFLGLPLLSNV